MAQNISQYNINPDAFVVRDIMDEILANVVQVFEDYNIPIPSRQYWTAGDPVWDCEQVVVTLLQLYYGTPGVESLQPVTVTSASPRSMVVNIAVCRNGAGANTSKIPSPVTIQNDANWMAVDTWTIFDAIYRTNNTGGSLIIPGWPNGKLSIATSQIVNPDGNIITSSVTVTMVVP